MSKKVFIYGSCVTRDAFNLPYHDFEVVDYVARSSMATAFLKDSFKVAEEKMDLDASVIGKFNLRQVRTDIHKELENKIRSTNADAIVIDLIDERFDIMEYAGTFATLSSELIEAGLIDAIPAITRSSYDTTQKLDAWKRGLDRFTQIVRDVRIPVIVNKVLYASVDNLGERFDEIEVHEHNKMLDNFYSLMPSDFRILDYSPELIIGDANHVWGRSPYHYVDNMMKHTLERLDKFLA